MDYQTWSVYDTIDENFNKACEAFKHRDARAACALHISAYFKKRISGQELSPGADNVVYTLVQQLGNICDDLNWSQNGR